MIFLSREVALFFFVSIGCMIVLVPRGCMIFFVKGLVNFFCPKGLRDFFCPERLRDFFLSQKVAGFFLSQEVAYFEWEVKNGFPIVVSNAARKVSGVYFHVRVLIFHQMPCINLLNNRGGRQTLSFDF